MICIIFYELMELQSDVNILGVRFKQVKNKDGEKIDLSYIFFFKFQLSMKDSCNCFDQQLIQSDLSHSLPANFTMETISVFITVNTLSGCGVTSQSMTVAFTRFTIWKIPISRLTFITSSAIGTRIASTLPILSVTEGILCSSVVTVAGQK